MRRSFAWLYAILIGFSATGAAQSATSVSLDRASFQAGLTGLIYTTQNFDSLPLGTLTSDGNVTYGALSGTPVVTNSFTTSSGTQGLGATPSQFFTGNNDATFTFMTAITFFAIDINTNAALDNSYAVALDNGNAVLSVFDPFPGRQTGQFIGFYSATPFTTVFLGSLSGNSYTLDTLIYGTTTAVPEPNVWAMMILGFALLGIILRRTRPVRVEALT